MRFTAFYKTLEHGDVERIVRESGVSRSSLYRLSRGYLLKSYALARRVSAATGGKVSVDELCSEAETPRKRGRR